MEPIRARPSKRAYHCPGRHKAVSVRYTDTEYTHLAEAAERAGLTATSFLAEAGLTAARSTAAPASSPVRELLVELIAARTQLRRVGVNLNQAVRALHTTGAPPAPWLEHATRRCEQAIARVDQTATVLIRVLGAGRG